MPKPPLPTPSPFRTLRRTALRSLLVLILLASLWLLWYSHASRKLDAKLKSFTASHEPAYPSHLVPTPLPANKNAHAIATDVYNTLALTADERSLLEGPEPITLPISDSHMHILRNMLASRPKTFERLTHIRNNPAAAWPMDPFPFVGGASMPNLGELRTLPNFCRLATRAYHQDLNDHAAIEQVHNIHGIATVYQQFPFLIGHLVAVSCDAMASQVLLEIASDLQIQSPSYPNGIPREKLQALIVTLLDHSSLNESFRNACLGERVLVPTSIADYDQNTWILRPMFLLDANRTLDQYTAFAAASGPAITSYPAAIRSIPTQPPHSSNLHSMVHLVSSTAISDRVFLMHYRARSDRAAAALRLALRLYEIDHNALPKNLADLVPHSLPALPPDPFRDDGHSFVYQPAKRLFYSVNENGVDDAGATHARAWNGLDCVYRLDRTTPTSSAPSTPTAPAGSPPPPNFPQTAPAPPP
jgi:hypothetical protein